MYLYIKIKKIEKVNIFEINESRTLKTKRFVYIQFKRLINGTNTIFFPFIRNLMSIRLRINGKNMFNSIILYSSKR